MKRRKWFSHHLISQSMTWEYGGYWELQTVTGDYRGLQGVPVGYRGLKGVTRGDN